MPDDLNELQEQQKAAEARKAIAEAEQKEAEAKKARAIADAAAARAASDAQRAEAQAQADHRKALAEAAQKEAEATKAAEAAERETADAADKARRERDKAEAENRKAITEAQVAAVKAFLPAAPTLKPLEGEVTVDEKAGVIVEMAAYELLKTAAADFAAAVKDKLQGATRVLIITDGQLAQSDWTYHSIEAQLRGSQQDLDSLSEILARRFPEQPAQQEPSRKEGAPREEAVPALLAAVAGLPQIAGAAADVAGYFQSDFTIKGRAIDAKVEPLVAAMAGALAAEGIATAVDGLHILPANSSTLTALSGLRASRSALRDARLSVERERLDSATMDVNRRTSDLKLRENELIAVEAATQVDEPKRAAAWAAVEAARTALQTSELTKGELQALVDLVKSAEQQADTLMTSVVAPPATGGLPPIGQALLREALHGQNPQVTHILHVAMVSVGGESQYRKRRFFAPKARYIGACSFTATLARTDGTVIASATKTVAGDVTYKLTSGDVGTLKRISTSS